MKIELTKESKITLRKIRKEFDKISTLFETIPNEDQEIINEFFSEGYSLNFCIRWGLSGCEELLEELQNPLKSKKERHKIPL